MRFHKESWGLLFPSVIEEFLPYAVVEAALAGTMPLVSRAGGVLEVLRDTPAERFAFRTRDVEDLVDKAERLAGLSRDAVSELSPRLGKL